MLSIRWLVADGLSSASTTTLAPWFILKPQCPLVKSEAVCVHCFSGCSTCWGARGSKMQEGGVLCGSSRGRCHTHSTLDPPTPSVTRPTALSYRKGQSRVHLENRILQWPVWKPPKDSYHVLSDTYYFLYLVSAPNPGDFLVFFSWVRHWSCRLFSHFPVWFVFFKRILVSSY